MPAGATGEHEDPHRIGTVAVAVRSGCTMPDVAVGRWSDSGPAQGPTLFALGALWAVSQDGLDSWHVRSHRLLSVVVGSGVGLALGIRFVSLTSAPVLGCSCLALGTMETLVGVSRALGIVVGVVKAHLAEGTCR